MSVLLADAVIACYMCVESGQVPLSKLFEKSTESWECPTCMITNNNTATTCAACTSPKPTAKNDPVSTEVFILCDFTNFM